MDFMADWQPDVMFADPSTAAGLRIILQARYQHLVLKFTPPIVSDSGLYEASWLNGGNAESESEEELLRIVCEELQDCGTLRHDWVTVSKSRDPINQDNILRTQRLECIYCDSRERVITVSCPQDLPGPRGGPFPLPTPTEPGLCRVAYQAFPQVLAALPDLFACLPCHHRQNHLPDPVAEEFKLNRDVRAGLVAQRVDFDLDVSSDRAIDAVNFLDSVG